MEIYGKKMALLRKVPKNISIVDNLFLHKKKSVRNSKCIRIRSFFLVYFHFGIEKVQNLLDQSANKAHIHRLLRKCLANTE